MKQLLMILSFFVIGMAIGGWGPRSDLRIAKDKIKTLEKNASTAPKPDASRPVVPDITRMLNVPQSSIRSSRSPHTPSPHETATPDPDGAFLPPTPMVSSEPIENIDDFKEAIEAAHDLWNMRQAQARQILIDRLELTESEMDSFDDAVREMNETLSKQIEDIAETLKDKETLTTEDGLTLVHEITGVMLQTYAQLDNVLPDNWQSEMTPDSDLHNFIDPMSALPLMDLEGKGMFGEEQTP